MTAPNSSRSNCGRVLNDRYQLVDMLGQGAMGRVYEAKDLLLGGMPVAVKFLAQTLLNQKMRDRFEREAKICANLGYRSRHIIQVINYGIDERDEVPFYVMEYLQGQTLSRLIERQPLQVSRFLRLAQQICRGLQTAHAGVSIEGKTCPIVHRDIKPSNVLIIQDENREELAKILDFGIAKTLQDDNNLTNGFMGTLAYASPEQMEGLELDNRSDIYSLGVMMFQMLTGKLPITVQGNAFGEWYRAHREQPPRSFAEVGFKPPISSVVINKLENLIRRCLAKSPSDRPQNAQEIIRQLHYIETSLQRGQDFGATLGSRPPRRPQSSPPKFSWPADKPTSEISFYQILPDAKGDLATLWVMLSPQEIEKRLNCKVYNHFLCTPAPLHPMILWSAALYNPFNPEYGIRWLSSFLDLKSFRGQQMTRLLTETGQYQILLFSTATPDCPTSTFSAAINADKCKQLKEWAAVGQFSRSVGRIEDSKDQLKKHLEELKPRITLMLESNSPPTILL